MDWVVIIPIVIIAMLLLGFLQAQFLSWQMRKEISHLEHQLNSNMERQIQQAIGEAVAKEQLRVQRERMTT